MAETPRFGATYAPLRAEVDVRDCVVEGALPENLSGGFYAVGPDPQYPLAQGNISLGYTQSETNTFDSPPDRARSFSLSGQLLYNLSDSTSINVVENLFRTISNDSQNNSLTQQLTVGLRKSF